MIIKFPIEKKHRNRQKAHYVGQKVMVLTANGFKDGIDTAVGQKEIENIGYGIPVFRTGNTYYGIRIKSYKSK